MKEYAEKCNAKEVIITSISDKQSSACNALFWRPKNLRGILTNVDKNLILQA